MCAAGPTWAKKKSDEETQNRQPEQFGDAALGRKYHKQIVQAYGEYDIDGLAGYVQRIGEDIARHADGEKFTWHFTLLDDETVNAFALPGGYIYITRGLLAHLNTEAQLAAVLGHEIGHVASRHAARQQTAARVVGKVTGSIGAASGGFNLGSLFGAGLVRGYGREMELEADESGARMVLQAGYDPKAMLEVIEILKARDEYESAELDEEKVSNPYHAMLASHPDKDKRLRELVAESHASGAIDRGDGRDEFLNHIDGMAWSGSKSQGVIRGSTFLHYDLAFALTFPEGWRIDNLPDRLLGWSASQDAVIQVSVTDRTERKRKKIPVNKFLQKVVGMRKWQSARELDVNGLPAFIATSKEMRSNFGIRTGRVAVIFHGDNAYVFQAVTQDSDRQRKYDRTFDQIITSMRPLQGDEKEQAHPPAIRIVQLPDGGSLADYEFESVNSSVSLLRLLNGFYPDGEPQAGSAIKIIR